MHKFHLWQTETLSTTSPAPRGRSRTDVKSVAALNQATQTGKPRYTKEGESAFICMDAGGTNFHLTTNPVKTVFKVSSSNFNTQ